MFDEWEQGNVNNTNRLVFIYCCTKAFSQFVFYKFVVEKSRDDFQQKQFQNS